LEIPVKNLFLAIFLSATAFATTVNSQSPYVGEESRAIKSLSQPEIDAYLQGHGMGYAKPAELNHYPGPRHVLDLAKELALTNEQIRQTQTIFEHMKSTAIDLGTQLVAKEAELDRQFTAGSIDAMSLDALVTDIASLDAKIRLTHLSAHLEQRALLSDHQVQLYDQLRGYDTMDDKEHSHSH
jgi:Spy/CpxP family protein refolding chaperone